MSERANYRRSGSCHGCGQHCCTTVVVPFTRAMGEQFLAHKPVWVEPSGDPDYDHWLELHGIDGGSLWLVPQFAHYRVIGPDKDSRVPIAVIPLRCHALSDDGSCSLYGNDDRPQMCADWPWEPHHLLTLSPAGQAACGYSFTRET